MEDNQKIYGEWEFSCVVNNFQDAEKFRLAVTRAVNSGRLGEVADAINAELTRLFSPEGRKP